MQAMAGLELSAMDLRSPEKNDLCVVVLEEIHVHTQARIHSSVLVL